MRTTVTQCCRGQAREGAYLQLLELALGVVAAVVGAGNGVGELVQHEVKGALRNWDEKGGSTIWWQRKDSHRGGSMGAVKSCHRSGGKGARRGYKLATVPVLLGWWSRWLSSRSSHAWADRRVRGKMRLSHTSIACDIMQRSTAWQAIVATTLGTGILGCIVNKMFKVKMAAFFGREDAGHANKG